MTRQAAEQLGCKPIARILGKHAVRLKAPAHSVPTSLFAAFADAETEPVDFSIAPAMAIPKVTNTSTDISPPLSRVS